MGKLFLFNPENDLALADNATHFTPPAAALRLAKAGAILPAWIGEPGDYYIADPETDGWIDSLRDTFSLHATRYNGQKDVSTLNPWGWSRYTRRRFIETGVNASLLPQYSVLGIIRELSHRRLTIDMHKSLSGASLPYPMPEYPEEVSSAASIAKRLEAGEHIYVKSPWSGSGRGIVDSASAPVRQVMRLATGVIGRQGSVMVERALDKVADFAMLYELCDGKASFKGLSLFYNSGYSAYAGNVLASQERLLEVLSEYVPREWLLSTAEAVGEALTAIMGDRYSGPAGVDMMIYRKESQFLIAPCVEVNLRYTMGMVARDIYRRFVAEGSEGVMRVERNEACNDLSRDVVVQDGRLVVGVLQLTPPGHLFSIVVEARQVTV